MELRQLRYFAKSAELLNFTEAAKKLFITQSTLSLQIKQLEEELGVLLFDRIGKRILLTEAGESFLPYARQTLQDTEYGKQKILDLQNIHTGSLRIGVTYSLSPLLTNAIIIFNRKYPSVKLDIQYSSSHDLIIQLKEHKFDFILSFLPNLPETTLDSVTLFDSSLNMVVHRCHPLSGLKQISWDRIQTESLILPSIGLSARALLDTILNEKRIQLHPQIEMNDVNAILQLVKTGSWISLLSKATIFDQKDLKAIPLKGKGVEMHASLIWQKNAYQKKSALVFKEIMEQRAKIHNIEHGNIL